MAYRPPSKSQPVSRASSRNASRAPSPSITPARGFASASSSNAPSRTSSPGRQLRRDLRIFEQAQREAAAKRAAQLKNAKKTSAIVKGDIRSLVADDPAPPPPPAVQPPTAALLNADPPTPSGWGFSPPAPATELSHAAFSSKAEAAGASKAEAEMAAEMVAAALVKTTSPNSAAEELMERLKEFERSEQRRQKEEEAAKAAKALLEGSGGGGVENEAGQSAVALATVARLFAMEDAKKAKAAEEAKAAVEATKAPVHIEYAKPADKKSVRRPLWESLGPASNDFIQERVPMNLLNPDQHEPAAKAPTTTSAAKAPAWRQQGAAAASEKKKVPLPKEWMDKAQAELKARESKVGSRP